MSKLMLLLFDVLILTPIPSFCLPCASNGLSSYAYNIVDNKELKCKSLHVVCCSSGWRVSGQKYVLFCFFFSVITLWALLFGFAYKTYCRLFSVKFSFEHDVAIQVTCHSKQSHLLSRHFEFYIRCVADVSDDI